MTTRVRIKHQTEESSKVLFFSQLKIHSNSTFDILNYCSSQPSMVNWLIGPIFPFSSTPSTEGVESTRGNSVCVSVCLSVRNHCFLLRIFNNLMLYTMQTIYFLKSHHAGNQYRPVLTTYHRVPNSTALY